MANSKAALKAFNNLLEAAGVLIEDHGFTPRQVSTMLGDVLRQINAEGPRFIPTFDELTAVTQ